MLPGETGPGATGPGAATPGPSARRGVVVVGSANVDLVVEVARRPAAGETLLGSDLVTTPGGKGANQAVAAGRLGAEVAFVGCVGDDSAGRLLRASLEGAGVDVSTLRVVPAPTGTAIILVTPDGNNSIVVAPGANRAMTPAAAHGARAVWRDAAVLVLQLEIPFDTVHSLARQADAAGVRVVLNAAPAAPLDRLVLEVCDPLVVNETEAMIVLGRPKAGPVTPDVVRDLLATGPRSVVVTAGGDGSYLARAQAPHDVLHVPAEAVRAVDTTGAGDAYVGAMAAALAEGHSLERAVRVATRAAALSVQRRGAQRSYPWRADLGPDLDPGR
ncbi:ribokinase [Cellulomonas hominis]